MREFVRKLATGVILQLCSLQAFAIEVERADSTFADRRYSFELVATLDAPIERVDSILKDYAAYPDLDARILEARVMERPAAGEVTLFTSLRACFGPFCRTVKRVEHVREEVHELRATTVPDQSDVSFGETFTQLSNAGPRTRVVYRTSVSPDFWIPRMIGRRFMLNTLRDATLTLFGNVEKRAHDSAPALNGETHAGTEPTPLATPPPH
jgi:hypothetical protein